MLQPKAEKQPDAKLPEWKPGGGGATNPVQRLLDSKAVQAKLTIGQPGDRYEQEADRVARDVVQRINSPVSETPQPENSLQRETEPEAEKLQMKPMLQRVHAVGGEDASQDLESSINRARGSGQPLDGGLQRSMGQAMGADFSGVRVHTDAQSDQLNQSIQAKAFTTGQDVFFRQGAYQPGSRGGQELIAHELTHVVQQNGQTIQRSQKQGTSSASADSLSPKISSNKSNPVVQRGFFEKYLGDFNPRKYLPEAIGGYTPEQEQINTTRAALRRIGLQDNAVETLVGIHITRNPPLGYNHPNMLILGQGVINIGGGNVVAQRMVNIFNAVGGPPVLPAHDLVTLAPLNRTEVDIGHLLAGTVV